ncbi:MAG: FTR1 family protein [Elainellaceae cyanobacterium]
MVDISAALPTFVVTLREGVEAALVVGIVLASLDKADQSRLNSWVYAGIGVGIGASVLIGMLLIGIITGLDASDQTSARVIKQLLEGGFSVVAIALLSWMLIWMTGQARQLKSDVENSLTATLTQGANAGWGIFGLITVAVLREGFETVIFIAAKFQQGLMPVLGAIAGLIGAVVIGFLLFRLGIRINLKLFFQGMGLLLLLIVSGLVITALRHFDAAALTLAQTSDTWATICPDATRACFLGPQVWDASQVLPDRQFPGILLKAFFGYTQHLYLAEAVGYLVFLTSVGRLYFQSLSIGSSGQNPQKTQGQA